MRGEALPQVTLLLKLKPKSLISFSNAVFCSLPLCVLRKLYNLNFVLKFRSILVIRMFSIFYCLYLVFSQWLSGKEFALPRQENTGLIPGLGRSSEEGNGKPLQYSCLGSLTDRGTWQATVHGVINCRTRFSNLATTIVPLLP